MTDNMQFSPLDAIKLQFQCERPSGGSINVSKLVTAADLGLTGKAGATAPVLTASFDQAAFLAAMTDSQDTALSPEERAEATAECLRLQADWQAELASQIEAGAQGQGESIANAIVKYLVAGNLKDAQGQTVSFSETDASAYVIRASELNIGPRVEVDGHGFFVASATATWG